MILFADLANAENNNYSRTHSEIATH